MSEKKIKLNVDSSYPTFQFDAARMLQQAQCPIADTLTALHSCSEGLTTAEAQRRLVKFGRNEVVNQQPPTMMAQFFMAFNNPFIWVLMVLATISFVTDYVLPLLQHQEPDLTGVIIIVVMVLISGVLRFWQEFRSSKAAEALKAMVKNRVKVCRADVDDGEAGYQVIDAEQLVVGDVIHLSPGDVIAADVKLLQGRDLQVSQAMLTGESLPVEKSPHYDAKTVIAKGDSGEQELLEQPNLCFMGTSVMSGSAYAVVIATGNQTYFASLAKAITGQHGPTAFDRGVGSVSRLLIRFMLVMTPLVFVLNGFFKGDWQEAFLFALAIGVGLTPEMLPMIVSSNLAKGAMMLARNKVVVKRLNAIQNLGAMDVLCTDKTGTLTEDNIILADYLNFEGQSNQRVLGLACLNSHHQMGTKNMLDKAIIQHPMSENLMASLMNHHKIDEIPFDFMRRRLSVVVQDPMQPGMHQLICKGAAEEMLAVSQLMREGDEVKPLTEEMKTQLLNRCTKYSEEGLKVLLIASQTVPAKERYSLNDEDNLIIEGILTFIDPPKESARQALQALDAKGVAIKVLTGDNAVIAARVCAQLGLVAGKPLLGHEIDQLSDQELMVLAQQRVLFAKLTPLQKARLVSCLQQDGRTVGFLGDGINDAPALTEADVGISVDSGTDIAKASADIILLEKSLMVLSTGVTQGRQIFGNIMKYLNITASSNFGNVFSMLVASLFLPFLPMLAIQLLIQNLIYDISQLSLPWDRVDQEYLLTPRKWDADNIGRFMLWMGPTSSVFDVITFAVMWFVFAANSVHTQSLFQSGWFVEGLISQTLVVHMLRTGKIPFVQSRATWPVMLMTLLVVVVAVVLPFSSLGGLIGLQPLPWQYFPCLVAILVGYVLLAQGVKRCYIRYYGQWF